MKVIVDGLATEYRDEGQGLVILMLHGWMNAVDSFDEITKRLHNSHRIIRVDLPGFGGTERPQDSWDVGKYASFVAHFIEKIGLGTYALVGHSFGGRITIKGASEGILRPSRIILIGAAGIPRKRTLYHKLLTALAKIAKFFTAIPPLSIWRQQIRKKVYERIGSDYFLAGRLSDIYLKVIKEDLSVHATNISVPTLLLWGENDTATPVADGKKFATLVKGSILKTYPNVGHFVHQERPDEVVAEIKKFV